MNTNKIEWDDTIIALATPPGIGAIGVIRLSGKNAIGATQNLMQGKKQLAKQASHTLHVVKLMYQNTILDEVVVSLYKNPSSYTGEDVVEISAHGSPFVQQKIIEAFLSLGVRMAKPGEFTLRAFLNGKLDLTQAEAVADLIASNTEAARTTAINNMKGGFSKELEHLREELIRFSALIELELDFAEEDVEFANRDQLFTLIEFLQKTVSQLLQSFSLGNVIKNGVKVAIVGHPNAGKSTLLNTLLNENRAIVSAIAGTTRDTIEEVLNIEGILFRLVDTAGIRTDSSDVIEQMGIEKSYATMKTSDIVLYVFDAIATSLESLQTIIKEVQANAKQFILVGNKLDAIAEDKAEVLRSIDNLVLISAKENKGINALKNQLISLTTGGKIDLESTIVTNSRHVDALQKLLHALNDVEQGLVQQITGDFLALDIRQCLHYLGEITGQITNEDQLDFIFSKFCIGK